MDLLLKVARFNANADRANLNCNRNPLNSKSKKDEISEDGMTQVNLGLILKYILIFLIKLFLKRLV